MIIHILIVSGTYVKAEIERTPVHKAALHL